MKPSPFAYHAPDTVDEALAVLAEHGDDAKVLAGGQSLVPIMALRLAAPAHLVDIGRIDALRSIERNGSLCIGAGITQRQAECSPVVAAWCPLLAAALPHIAHPQIRNRGTVCGSLAHADPAAELPAVALALDMQMVIDGPRGTRTVAARDFFVSYLETAVAPDELLVRVDVPPWPAGAGSSFLEISRRSGDFALVGTAAFLRLAPDGTVAEARLSFTGVAATPVRVATAEHSLVGRRLDDDALGEAAALVSTAIDPPGDVHATASYRRHVAGVLTRRALQAAAAPAKTSSAPA